MREFSNLSRDAVLSFLSAEGKRFRRSGGLPPQAREALRRDGDVRHDMACALPPPGGGSKKGQGHIVSLPLLTPLIFL